MATYYAKETQATFAHAVYPDVPQATDSEKYGACHVQGSNEWIYRSFLKHDIGGVPYKSKIASAKLWVYCFYHHDNAATATHNFARVTESWDENTLTWNNKPEQHTDMYLDEWVLPPAVNAWGSYDITRMVQEWVDGTYPNYGLQFINNNEGAYRTEWCFYNRRIRGGQFATYIEIEYEPAEEVRITKTRMTEIADEVRRITGATDTMTTAQIITALQGISTQTTEATE